MSIVFDAEPLLAFGLDESGASVVESYLDAVFNGDALGYISVINLSEVRYVIINEEGRARADTYIHYFMTRGIQLIDAKDVWENASMYKSEYSIPIADAYAISSANYIDEPLLIGPDDHFDDAENDDIIDIERFRQSPP